MSNDEKFPSQLAERFQIRLPDGMRDKLRTAAEQSGRSMNTEIILRLQHSLSRYANLSDHLSSSPLRDSMMLRLFQRIEHKYNDMCNKLEEGNARLEKENELLKREIIAAIEAKTSPILENDPNSQTDEKKIEKNYLKSNPSIEEIEVEFSRLLGRTLPADQNNKMGDDGLDDRDAAPAAQDRRPKRR